MPETSRRKNSRRAEGAGDMQSQGQQPAGGVVMNTSMEGFGEMVVMPMATAAALADNALGQAAVSDSIPTDWKDRAKKAWTYFVEEPLVKHCVSAWRSFAVGDEIRVRIIGGDDETQKDLNDFLDTVKLSPFVKDMLLQLLVKGDAVGFQRMDGTEISELVCVNPVSVQPKYVDGQLTEMKQYPEEGAAPGSTKIDASGLDLPVEQTIHLKWDAPPFSPRGNSMVIPAFESIELLRDYRRAERAIAKRWATPLRFITVGGAYGSKLVMPDQKMLQDVSNMINKMNLRSGLVVPFYVDVKTYGTEGEVLKVEEKVKEVKEDIIVALGMSRSLVTGDGPNFATASISFQKMVIMIREIKQVAKTICYWVLNAWAKTHGHEDVTFQLDFNDLDPSDAAEWKKILLELYDRKLITRQTLLSKMELDAQIEDTNRENSDGVDVSLLDDKQVKPIVDLVNAGVLAPDVGARILGIKPEDMPRSAPAEAIADGGPAARANLQTDVICDDCQYFDSDNNHCPVCKEERHFYSKACRFIDPKPSLTAQGE